MKIKRSVSKNLGRTQHHHADDLYILIRKKIGPFRRCPFYHGKKYPKFHENEHDLLNKNFPNPNVPIEEFDFAKKPGGEWGLQAYCRICYKAYRDARIHKSRATWIKRDGSLMNENEIRSWYRKNVSPKMICSVCKRKLDPKYFSISRSMEKGLHNECFDCQGARANSVREQEWLSDGNWSSWTRAVLRLRRSSKVKCRGWPRSVKAGECLVYMNGKRIHADHIVPLRAGGVNDARNLQPLCTVCNEKKSDQIDPSLSPIRIRRLVGVSYKSLVKEGDSVATIERKLKNGLRKRVSELIENGTYLDALKEKKKEVNGQWKIARAYRKGFEWFSRIKKGWES